MTLFPKAPTLRPVNNDKWIVEDDFACMIKGYFVTVRKGFETDGASIPRSCWWFIGHPFNMPLLPCALINDALYAGELVSRTDAEWLFLCLMQRAKIGWAKRNAIWSAVKLGGWLVWSRHNINGILHARKHCGIQCPKKKL